MKFPVDNSADNALGTGIVDVDGVLTLFDPQAHTDLYVRICSFG